MHQRARTYAASAAAVAVFVVIQLGAVSLARPFRRAGYRAVQNPSNPTNSVAYIAVILVATVLMLLVIRLGFDWLLRGFVVLSSALVSLYVFSVLAPSVVATVAGVVFNPLALGATVVLALALLLYPEWYVLDAAGVVMGIGAAGIFGISFGILPAVVLLVLLAVYDAISVYGTEHMLTLADGVMDLNLPVVLVFPLSLSYSYLADEPAPDGGVEADGGERESHGSSGSDGDERDTPEGGDSHTDPPEASERDVFFIGLGDAVMPGVLVASAAFFAPARPLIQGFALSLPALTAMVGTVCGLVVLLWLVLKGRAHAGLPLLNGGAIGGYLVGAVLSGIPVVTALGLGPYL